MKIILNNDASAKTVLSAIMFLKNTHSDIIVSSSLIDLIYQTSSSYAFCKASNQPMVFGYLLEGTINGDIKIYTNPNTGNSNLEMWTIN